MTRCFLMFALLLIWVSVSDSSEGEEAKLYDYRESRAFAELSKDQRQKLAKAIERLDRIQAALHKYADDHNDEAPETLDHLVPKHLDKLPKDPFATRATAAEKPESIRPMMQSADGYGYRYLRGRGRSWWLYSVGLKTFPFRYASKNNAGIGYVEGYWYGPVQFMLDVF